MIKVGLKIDVEVCLFYISWLMPECITECLFVCNNCNVFEFLTLYCVNNELSFPVMFC